MPPFTIHDSPFTISSRLLHAERQQRVAARGSGADRVARSDAHDQVTSESVSQGTLRPSHDKGHHDGHDGHEAHDDELLDQDDVVLRRVVVVAVVKVSRFTIRDSRLIYSTPNASSALPPDAPALIA